MRRHLGDGRTKRVFRVRDTRLDREVAPALVRTEGLDATGRERVAREAQSMGRLGAHANLVTVHDVGEEAGQPYIVDEYMAGGSVAGASRPRVGPASVVLPRPSRKLSASRSARCPAVRLKGGLYAISLR